MGLQLYRVATFSFSSHFPFSFVIPNFAISQSLSFVISLIFLHLLFCSISMKKLQYNLVLLAFSIIFAENIISYGHYSVFLIIKKRRTLDKGLRRPRRVYSVSWHVP